MRRLIRWAVGMLIVLLLLIVAGLLCLNSIVKQMMESRLRAATGMNVTIRAVDIGLLSPTLTIDHLKIYNTADFGGSVFINLPELRVVYDPFALQTGNLHFKLVRLNLAEVSLIQDKKGRLNVQEFAKKGATASKPGEPLGIGGKPIKFTGIDVLNLTLGRFRMSNLGNGREEVMDFGLTNQITRNVKSQADLAALNLILAARASLAAASSTNSVLDVSSLLNFLTH